MTANATCFVLKRLKDTSDKLDIFCLIILQRDLLEQKTEAVNTS